MHSRDNARARASELFGSRPRNRARRGRTRFRAARDRVGAQVVILFGAAVVAVGTAQPAAAEDGWSMQPAPRPPHSSDTSLYGVSCTSTRDCVAVGYSTAASTGNASPPVERDSLLIETTER